MSITFITRGALALLSVVSLTACSNVNAIDKPVNISPTTAAVPVAAPPAASEIFVGPVNPVKSETPVAPGPTNVLTEEPGTRINATWITPVTVIQENIILIPASKLEEDTLIHFFVSTSLGKMPFMAYIFEGKTYVRAGICVPCKSYDFSLQQNVLICESCGSRFNAETGNGVSGACVKYPKAEVAYEKKDGNVLLKWEALKTAYQSTLGSGLQAPGGSTGGQPSCH